jgi:hypothetical protein
MISCFPLLDLTNRKACASRVQGRRGKLKLGVVLQKPAQLRDRSHPTSQLNPRHSRTSLFSVNSFFPFPFAFLLLSLSFLSSHNTTLHYLQPWSGRGREGLTLRRKSLSLCHLTKKMKMRKRSELNAPHSIAHKLQLRGHCDQHSTPCSEL